MARSRVAKVLVATVALGACRAYQAPAPPPASPLPPISISQADSVRPRDPRLRAPLPQPAPAERRVTLTAVNADARALLLTLAEAAGVSLVFGGEVASRVSVKFEDVPARVAMQAVLDQAGLSVASGPMEAPWGPTVFYVLPVNIDEASEEMLRARFGVSAEVARWIVQNRKR